MRWLKILRLRFRSLSQRAAVERELEDELRSHFDLQVEQNRAAGMDPVEAHNAALRQFGQPTQYKDECRDARRTRMIESFWEDSCYAVRNLRRDPFLAFAATLTLQTTGNKQTVLISSKGEIRGVNITIVKS